MAASMAEGWEIHPVIQFDGLRRAGLEMPRPRAGCRRCATIAIRTGRLSLSQASSATA
jgi:hypothetical protein